MTTILDLPRDLVEEILSRLPMKYVRVVRSTCREWNTLTKSQSFAKMPIGKEASAAREGESRMILLMDEVLHLMSVFIKGDPSTGLFIEGDPSIEHKGKLSFMNEDEQVKISRVFHCNGLLLCLLKDRSRFVVWNPQGGSNPDFLSGGWDMDRYSYALGYAANKEKKSYKVLRFFDQKLRPSRNISAPRKRFQWCEIFDFDSDLWTTLDFSPHWSVRVYQLGASLKGNTYFCATKTNSEDGRDDHLICFDFTSEGFGPLLPFPFSAGHNDTVTLSCVREEELAVLLSRRSNRRQLDIWLTTKIESEEVLWSKFLALDTAPHFPIAFSGFYIDEKKKVAMGFDNDWDHHRLNIVGEAKYLRTWVLGDKISETRRVCSYVPSAVQIKKQGKSAKQSHLEKRGYDEKMLALVALENPVNEHSAGEA